MNKILNTLLGLAFFLSWQSGYSAPDRNQLAVWANEAIIATYTYDYKNYVAEQKEIAKYFSAEGWMAYTKALNDSKLPEAVQKNNYYVSAVATHPPIMTILDPTHWQATMPVLVVYTNPQYEQRQNLKVVLSFSESPSGQGVRGLSINSLQATVTEPPCQCNKNDENTAAATPTSEKK